MLIIARHGQSDDSPYHGVSGLKRAAQTGADIVYLSSRLTRDSKLVLAASAHVGGDKHEPLIRKSTLKELRRHTAGSKQPIALLSDALSLLFGTVMICIEISERSAVEPLLACLEPYIKRRSGWGNVLFCSHSPLVLIKLRHVAPHSQLSLLHSRHTPLVFLAWQPTLQLSAIIVHRLSVNSLVVEAAHRLDLLVCAYTVDRPKAVTLLEELGVDAVVTNHPEKLI